MALVVGLLYAVISVYWGLGGTWLLNTVGGSLEEQGRAGNAGVHASATADHRALAWHAYLWDPWFLIWGLLVAGALLRGRYRRHQAAAGS